MNSPAIGQEYICVICNWHRAVATNESVALVDEWMFRMQCNLFLQPSSIDRSVELSAQIAVGLFF
ncbi:hypothetical protein DS906_03260 [Ruegeria sp. A3M17]|nr:hypothetical protein DS906_03260 [Ruegeria sp. A3M17]